MTLVSIIITTYNYARYLRTALESACAQGYPALEILVLDNASGDDTAAVVAEFSGDGRIRYIRHPENIGAVANHTAGVHAARGEYVIFLSADDMLLPGRIERQLAFAQAHPQYDLTYAAFYTMDEHGVIADRLQPVGEPSITVTESRDEFPLLLAYGNYMCFPTLLIPRRLFLEYGDFDPRVDAIDFEMVLRWSAAGVQFGYFAEAVHIVRVHERQTSSPGRYAASGKDALEYAGLVARYIQPRYAARLDDFRERITCALKFRLKRCRTFGFEDDGTLDAYVENIAGQLADPQVTPEPRAADSKLVIFVLYDAPLPALLVTLHSLIKQTDGEWRAFVVQTPHVGHDGLWRALDARRRIHSCVLQHQGSLDDIVNELLVATDADSFAFLHAGSHAAPEYVAEMRETLRSRPAGIVRLPYRIAGGTGEELVPRREGGDDVVPVPLESFAIRRKLVDRFGFFAFGSGALCGWDMILRLGRHVPPVPVAAIVTVVHDSTRASRYDDVVAFARDVRQCYERHGAGDPATAERRERYLARLDALAGSPPAPERTIEHARKLMQTVFGEIV